MSNAVSPSQEELGEHIEQPLETKGGGRITYSFSDKDKIIHKDYTDAPWLTRKVLHLPEAMLGLAVGIASMSTLYNNSYKHLDLYDDDTAEIVALTFASIGIVMIAVYGIKVILCWDKVANCFYCPTDSAVFPLIGMAFMTFGAGCQPYSPTLAQGMWYFGLLSYAALLGNFLYRNRYCNPYYMSWNDIRDTTVPLLMIPFVGIELGTVSSVTIDVTWDQQENKPDFVGEFCFFAGVVGAIIIMPPTMARLFFGAPLSDASMPTIFIMMAPKYLMLAAWLTNYPTNATGPHEMVAHALFVCGGWSYCYTHYKVAQRALSLPGYYLPFAFSFASFTFPIDAVAIALMKYYGATGWDWSKKLATFVFGEANLVLALVVCRFLLELYRNLTTQAPTICEGDQEDAKGKTYEIQPGGSAHGGSNPKLDLQHDLI
mmetsp:Transcript_32504/g.54536  ORF Transcript_32504/g.54536 Transcript_32504/m.54536 type:complete len:430 (+) Transcript_32504:351-1640(+)|eukprot:CAMPEP_0198201116 /NCGR_PEP_ID=MMETSP1445-20131203/3914_1 /TAXON_ID=36898 /ORGANISM="Pyramimonas sp., Strain CCMP2087" /LENGTH=429 /DNA_ID=CAMNT_0043871311 /DNA_START=349 /DNA_END=1638 /DNA_ORIENTATION=-